MKKGRLVTYQVQCLAVSVWTFYARARNAAHAVAQYRRRFRVGRRPELRSMPDGSYAKLHVGVVS